jgi:transposase
MEACASAHFWANKLISMGHNVKLMALSSSNPMLKPISMMLQTLKLFVKPSRPNMRFVPVKTAEQQAVLALHRSRQSFIKQRTAQANQIRGLLAGWHCRPPEVSSSYSDDYLSSWKMRITRYPSCFVHS